MNQIELLEMIEPKLLTKEQIANLLPILDDLEAWCKQVKEYALNEALSGNDIPGYKVVEGRTNRKWTNEQDVIKAINNSDYDLIDFEEIKLISPSKVESLIGKKAFNELFINLIEKTEGKPTLVPLSDKRQAIKSNINFNDFE